MFKPLSFAILGLGAAAFLPAVASAATVFTDRATFLANVQSGSYLETFDSLPPASSVASPQTFSQGAFSYTADAANGLFTAGTSFNVWLTATAPADPIIFTFTSGNVTAVGGFFFGSDFNGGFQSGDVTIALNDGTTQTITSATTDSFLGFTGSVPIISLTVTAVQPNIGDLYPTVNDFIVGQQVVTTPAGVPEPSARAGLTVMPLGAILWGVLRRRRA
jgi:hypothetical protein